MAGVRPMGAGDQLKQTKNLSVLQRLDPEIVQVVGSAGHVALYAFQTGPQVWERKDVEGSLFVARRDLAPFYRVVVLNRLSTTNWIETISSELQLEIVEPYLLLKNKDGEITGIWFYNNEEQQRIITLIQSLIEQQQQPQPSDESAAVAVGPTETAATEQQAPTRESNSEPPAQPLQVGGHIHHLAVPYTPPSMAIATQGAQTPSPLFSMSPYHVGESFPLPQPQFALPTKEEFKRALLDLVQQEQFVCTAYEAYRRQCLLFSSHHGNSV
ncbi:mRNA-decapping enzyme 1B [Balamuthia mandrillaris]